MVDMIDLCGILISELSDIGTIDGENLCSNTLFLVSQPVVGDDTESGFISRKMQYRQFLDKINMDLSIGNLWNELKTIQDTTGTSSVLSCNTKFPYILSSYIFKRGGLISAEGYPLSLGMDMVFKSVKFQQISCDRIYAQNIDDGISYADALKHWNQEKARKYGYAKDSIVYHNGNFYVSKEDGNMEQPGIGRLKITFNTNGRGQVSPTEKTVTHGETYGNLPTAIDGNDESYGWFLNQNLYLKDEISANSVVLEGCDHTLYAGWKLSILGKPNNIEYGGVTGSGLYRKWDYVTLTETPSTNYEFVEWVDENGNPIGTTNPISRLVSSDCVYTANFRRKKYNLTRTYTECIINDDIQGNQIDSGSQYFAKFVPNDGCEMKTMTCTMGGNNVEILNNAEHGYYVQIPSVSGNIDIYGKAEQVQKFTLTVVANNNQYGTVTGGKTDITPGESVTITATPKNGYHFVQWNPIGITTNPYTFTVNQSSSLTGVFEQDEQIYYTLTLDVQEGNGTLTGGGRYKAGTRVTAKATGGTGYNFDKWKKNDIVVSTNSEYSFELQQDTTLKAFFALKTFSIQRDITDCNISESITDNTIKADETYQATITAKDGYSIVDDDHIWCTVGGTQVQVSKQETQYTIDIQNVSGDIDVHAEANKIVNIEYNGVM